MEGTPEDPNRIVNTRVIPKVQDHAGEGGWAHDVTLQMTAGGELLVTTHMRNRTNKGETNDITHTFSDRDEISNWLRRCGVDKNLNPLESQDQD